jgi:hypothetical protein
MSNITGRLPKFFNYKEDVEEAEQGYETMQDFFLSWTFRCAAEKCKSTDEQIEKIHLYAKKALFSLIYGKNNEDYTSFSVANYEEEFVVKDVRVWRQWKRIDLLVEVDAIRNGVPQNFALNIENKWYTHIKNGQLATAKNATEHYYKEEEPEDREIINLVIFCDECYERNPQNVQECIKNGYKLLTIEDIAGFMNMGGKKTGNALFDEYWFD